MKRLSYKFSTRMAASFYAGNEPKTVIDKNIGGCYYQLMQMVCIKEWEG